MSIEPKFAKRIGYAVALLATALCFAIFYYDTLELEKSAAAALITGGLVLATFMVLRWLISASRSKD